jgi:hypothetical protein
MTEAASFVGTGPQPPPLYTPRQRGIFDFSDGLKKCYADPLAVNRKLRLAEPDLDGTLREYNRLFYDEAGKSLYEWVDANGVVIPLDANGFPSRPGGKPIGKLLTPNTQPPPGVVQPALAAEARLVNAARAAFELPEVNRETGEGFSDRIALEALWRFVEFQEKNALRVGS